MSTKKKTETTNQCEFCKRSFIRESTMFSHLCESKRRWNERDNQVNRMAHNAYKLYHQKNHPTKLKLEYIDFIYSPVYSAFIKFANYCITNHVINIPRFMDYLVSHKVIIDHWNSDIHYTKFLIEYLKLEDPFDAIKRSIESLSELCVSQNIQIKDSFRLLSDNRLCHHIVNGQISPWFLYSSQQGLAFIERLNQDQIKLIFDYINPDVWSIKLYREKETVDSIKTIMKELSL